MAPRKPATIAVRRAERWGGRMRRVDVLIGTALVGELASGERQSFEVKPGTHRVLIRAPWATSNPLELALRSGELADLEYSDDSKVNAWGMGLCGGMLTLVGGGLQLVGAPSWVALPLAAIITLGGYATLEKLGILTPLTRYEAWLKLTSEGKP